MYKNYKTPSIISSSNLQGIIPLAVVGPAIVSALGGAAAAQALAAGVASGLALTGLSAAQGKKAHISELRQRQLLPILKEEF